MTLITRRSAIIGAAGAILASDVAHSQPAELKLRILATSDLHMFALDWDYFLNRPDPTVGLNKLATLIKRARNEAPNCLLLDNGDILQGSPMGDFLATTGRASDTPHAFLAAMNALKYDAATLGNHEFNFGLPFLAQTLGSADFPFICANVYDAVDQTLLPPFMVLHRELTDVEGALHKVRVGVIGFVPHQIMVWDRVNLEGNVRAQTILESARRWLPELRTKCDLVIALCHSGIGDGRERTDTENVAEQVAAFKEVDVVISGHSHRVFPGPDYAGRPGVDAQRGALHGKPAVMPGFWGSHLGVIDLNLAHISGQWHVQDFQVEARPIYRRESGAIVELAEPDPGTTAVFTTAHTATQDWVSQPIGELDTPLHSYFVWASLDLPTELINRAQLDYANSILAGTPLSNLPLLSAAAPFRVGYTPDAYVDIKTGPIAIRDAANIYPYSNTVAIVKVNGIQLKDWLEHAARVFNRIDPHKTDPQPLLDLRVPTYNFDVISGLSYEIDLSEPPRTDANGHIVAPHAHRIKNLRRAGEAVLSDQEFLVVTNNYRAGGGGRFPSLDGKNIIFNDTMTNRDALVAYIRKAGKLSIHGPSPWTFSRNSRGRVWFDSAVASQDHLLEVSSLSYMGRGREGYLRHQMRIGDD